MSFLFEQNIFSHFDYNYVRIDCFFVTQNRKLLISSSRMRDFAGKNSVKFFVMFLFFFQKIGGMGKRKRAHQANPANPIYNKVHFL